MHSHLVLRCFTLIALLSPTLALGLPSTPTHVPLFALNNRSASFASSVSGILSNSSEDLADSLPLAVCNGSLLGTNLNRGSCFKALQTIGSTKGRQVFGDRAFGNYDIPLPRRYISGMASALWSDMMNTPLVGR